LNGDSNESRTGSRVNELESVLLERARRGDDAAFESLAELHAPALHRLAFSLAGNASDAEDMVQETLLGAYQRLKAFEGRSSFKTWLSRILVNQTARLRRSKRVREVVKATDFSEASQALLKGMKVTGLQDESRNSEIRMDVMAALSGMSDEFRTVIVLREMEGLSYAEIAGVLDVPQGTVESRLFRARAELKHLLKEYL